MLKGLMRTHNAQQHQGISLRRHVALLRHQHSDNNFNDSDHCAKLNSGPPQKQTSDGPQPTQKQTVRATACSPSEKPHLRTLHIVSLMTSTEMLLQQQKADRIQQTASATKDCSSHHNLKEEPSALRSLSIFDSTETEQKMHNGRRPVVEIAICM